MIVGQTVGFSGTATPSPAASSTATYVCVPGANQYGSASSREMFGSNAYVSPAATTSWKMFQIGSQSASVAGRIFIAAKKIVGQPLRSAQFQQLSEANNAASAADLLLCAPRSREYAVSARSTTAARTGFHSKRDS